MVSYVVTQTLPWGGRALVGYIGDPSLVVWHLFNDLVYLHTSLSLHQQSKLGRPFPYYSRDRTRHSKAKEVAISHFLVLLRWL